MDVWGLLHPNITEILQRTSLHQESAQSWRKLCKIVTSPPPVVYDIHPSYIKSENDAYVLLFHKFYIYWVQYFYGCAGDGELPSSDILGFSSFCFKTDSMSALSCLKITAILTGACKNRNIKSYISPSEQFVNNISDLKNLLFKTNHGLLEWEQVMGPSHPSFCMPRLRENWFAISVSCHIQNQDDFIWFVKQVYKKHLNWFSGSDVMGKLCFNKLEIFSQPGCIKGELNIPENGSSHQQTKAVHDAILLCLRRKAKLGRGKSK